ncbi:MAG: GNAT family N-acetyltransferase [Planctomycetota bacterium]
MSETGIKIEYAAPEDAETICDFQLKMALETEDKILDSSIVLPAVRAVFEDPRRGFYMVARDGENVVGCLLITYEWSDWRNCDIWYFQSVFVEQEYRGRGIFTLMYERIMELAREADIMFVRLFVEVENDRAQRTYERLGMKKMPYYMYDVKLRD